MKKTISLFLVLFFLYSFLYSQKESRPLQTTLTVDFAPVSASIVGELPITKRSTVKGELGTRLGLSARQFGGELEWGNCICPKCQFKLSSVFENTDRN